MTAILRKPTVGQRREVPAGNIRPQFFPASCRLKSWAGKTWICLSEHLSANGSVSLFGGSGILLYLELPAAVQAIDIFRSEIRVRLTNERERGRAHKPNALVGSTVNALRLVAVLEEPKAATITGRRPVQLSRVVLRDLIWRTAKLIGMH
jgi:hypothetical protein